MDDVIRDVCLAVLAVAALGSMMTFQKIASNLFTIATKLEMLYDILRLGVVGP